MQFANLEQTILLWKKSQNQFKNVNKINHLVKPPVYPINLNPKIELKNKPATFRPKRTTQMIKGSRKIMDNDQQQSTQQRLSGTK